MGRGRNPGARDLIKHIETLIKCLRLDTTQNFRQHKMINSQLFGMDFLDNSSNIYTHEGIYNLDSTIQTLTAKLFNSDRLEPTLSLNIYISLFSHIVPHTIYCCLTNNIFYMLTFSLFAYNHILVYVIL